MVCLRQKIGMCVCVLMLCFFSASAGWWESAPKPTLEVRLDDYFVTNVVAQQRKYLKFEVAFQVLDKETSEAILHNQLMLNSAILLSVSSAQYEELKTSDGKKAFQNRLQQELIVLLKQQQLPHAIASLSFPEFILD